MPFIRANTMAGTKSRDVSHSFPVPNLIWTYTAAPSSVNWVKKVLAVELFI